MALWITSDWLEEPIILPADDADLESAVRQRGQNGCRYVSADCRGNVYIEGMFDKDKAVQDVDRYRICKRGCDVCLIPHGEKRVCAKYNSYNDHPCEQHNGNTVILLLESPHIGEYNECHGPIAPAQGKTGENIHRFLKEALKSNQCLTDRISVGCDTRIVLCNPVPFQTSLHMIFGEEWCKAWRDTTWCAIWGNPCIKEYFRDKILQYNPQFVINACTGEAKDNYIKRRLVTEFLQRIPVEIIYESPHPSSWHWPNNRKITRVLRGNDRCPPTESS